MRVDVERQSSTTRRPDGGGEWNSVSDLIAIGRADEGSRGRCLSGRYWIVTVRNNTRRIINSRSRTAREVISRLLDPCHTLVKTSVSTEFGVEDAVLESGWILEIQVDLAVQAGVCDRNSGTNGGNK